MLKIRLQRTGRRNNPSYRVVVTEHTRGPKSQKHVDRVGFYNPKTKEKKLDEAKIKHWISVGAQTSGTMHNMLVKAGIIKGETINVLPQKTPVVKEVEEKKEEKKETSASDNTVSEETKKDAEVSEGDSEKTTEETPVVPESVEEDKKEEPVSTKEKTSTEEEIVKEEGVEEEKTTE